MKKILSILGTISLSTIISTNIIACKPTNKENKTSKPIEPKLIPQQPPTNSNWKLINKDNLDDELLNTKNKIYLFIGMLGSNSEQSGILVKNINDNIKWLFGRWRLKSINNKDLFINYGNIKKVYYWNDINEPTIPTIDKNTGKIIKWNEK